MAATVGRVVLAAGVGYALGMAPSADAASHFATRGSIDLRETGSGNPGAKNAADLLGARWGAAVLASDAAKGIAAAAIGRIVAGEAGACAGAASVVAGHIWPAWNGFRGGKGVATAAGTCVVVSPELAPLVLGSGALTAAITRDAERSVQVGACVWFAAAGRSREPVLVALVAALSLMVLGKFAWSQPI